MVLGQGWYRYFVLSLTFAFTLFASDAAFSQPIVLQENFDGLTPLAGWSPSICIKNDPVNQVCGMGTFSRLLDPKGPPTPLSAPSSAPNWGFVQISNPISNPGSGVEVRYQKSFNVVVEDDYPISAVLGTKDCAGCTIYTQLYVDGGLVFEDLGIDTNGNTAPHTLKFPHSGMIHLISGTHMIELGMQTPSAVTGSLRASFDDIKIGVDPDNDGDGYSVFADCNDNDSTISPGAPEINDGIDNNCNGIIDEGFSPAGSYYNVTDNTVKLCPLGRYQPNPDQTSCIDSPAGSYVNVMGTVSAMQCLAGTYQPLAGQTSCIEAPVGTFVDGDGAVSATQCPSGTYQPNTGQVSCMLADVGFYVPVTGSAEQLECQTGQYQDQIGQNQCVDSPPGTFTDTSGAVQPIQCEPGSYQPLSAQTSCLLADSGFFVEVYGAAAQSECPAGTTSEIGATSCTIISIEETFCHDMTIEQLMESGSYNVIDNRDGHLGKNIKGTRSDDLILLSDLGNNVSARQGDDCIIGGAGNDKIHGDKGDDQIFGGDGDDKIQGQQGNDVIFGGSGNDRIHGGRDNDIIAGDEGNDVLYGGKDNDTITGGSGNDKIHGANGNDTIDGGDGNDRCRADRNDNVTNCELNDKLMKEEDEEPEEDDTSNDHQHNEKHNEWDHNNAKNNKKGNDDKKHKNK